MKHKTPIIAAVTLALILLAVAIQPLVAQSGNTWTVNFYNNPDWSGDPVAGGYYPYVDFNWGYGSPSPAVPVDNFSARMTTDAFFYSGNYIFGALADDEVILKIDGVTYLDTRGAGKSGKQLSVTIPMTQGTHRVGLDYREYTGVAYVFLNWAYQKPGGGNVYTPLPTPAATPAPVCPTSAASVQTQYGDYTPCITNKQHQANCFVSDGQWDSPNLGSIQMEPQIVVWGACTPNSETIMVLYCSRPPQPARCSKTGAGWFPQ